jgi:hypothetical protein
MVTLAELVFELKVVFDDSVVHNDDAARAVSVRMCILFRRATMSSPAGVTNAVSAIERIESYSFFQITKLAFGAADLEIMALVHNCDAGGVISPVFEFTQAINDQGHDLLISYITNYSTHKLSWAVDDLRVCFGRSFKINAAKEQSSIVNCQSTIT